VAIGTPVSLGSVGHAAEATLVLTTGADAPVGSLIFVAGVQQVTSGTVVSSCTDQKSNSYSALGSANNASGASTGAAYANNTASDLPSGDTISATFGTSAATVAMAALAVSGIATSSPLDINNVNATGNSSSPSAATGTLAQASEIIFAILGWSTSGGTITEDTTHGWTSLVTFQGNTMTLHIAYQIVSATTSVTYAPTISATREWTVQLFSFKGVAASGPSPFSPIDQPNPRGAILLRIDAQSGPSLSLLGVTAPTPFYQTNQPNPRGPAPLLQDHRAFAALTLQVGLSPFIPPDISPPVRAIVARQDGQQFASPALQIGLKPFNQTDQPNPRRNTLIPQDFWTQASPAVQIGLNPFRQNDQPLPTPRVLGRFDHWTQASPAIQIGLSPFNQTDQPNPRRVVPSMQDWQVAPFAVLHVVVQPPFIPNDFPNPRLNTLPRFDWQAYASPNLQIGLSPFRQNDQPNPGLPQPPRQDWRAYASPNLNIGLSPFRQNDQPLPTRGILTRQDTSAFVPLNLVVIFPKPFTNYDWPNPRGYAPAMQHWQMQGGYSTYFPPPPPPIPPDSRADGIDRTTGTYIFPGVDTAQRNANLQGMLAGTVLVQTWIQLQTLGIFIGGSLPQFYEPGALR
jgi:hypothetical protein